MSRRWRLLILLLALGIVAGGIALNERNNGRLGGGEFADIDKALAPLTAQGWKLAVAPKEPGPYRLLSSGPLRGSDAGQQGRVRDKSGQVIEEMK